MFRLVSALLAAAFLFGAGSAMADPQYTRATLPTANLWNRSGHTARVEFFENGVLKQSMLTYAGSSIYPIHLQGVYVVTGTVDVAGKPVAIAHRTLDLKLGASLNVSVASNGSGGFLIRDGT